MKKLSLLITVVLLLLALPLSALADEAAKYNFASAQGGKDISVKPGSESSGDIYFYNIDGNRITHIILEVANAPSGWKITVDPPLSDVTVLVNEMPVTVTENLYVEPTELLADEPATVPEGMVSIKVPGRGYALGKHARVIVEVPDSVSVGTTGTITIAAEASWLGQGGAAAVKQARDFEFNVTVVSSSDEYTETIVGQEKESKTMEATGTEQPADTPASSDTSGGSSIKDWFPAIAFAVIVVVGLVLVTMLILRRRRSY